MCSASLIVSISTLNSGIVEVRWLKFCRIASTKEYLPTSEGEHLRISPVYKFSAHLERSFFTYRRHCMLITESWFYLCFVFRRKEAINLGHDRTWNFSTKLRDLGTWRVAKKRNGSGVGRFGRTDSCTKTFCHSASIVKSRLDKRHFFFTWVSVRNGYWNSAKSRSHFCK